jgi:CMP-N,N'-diacetyllegionaminic acid synthase
LKILALILARGGSKRVPGKNTRVLGAKPLLTWSIDVVRGIPEIVSTLVSTDDAAIAELARQAGALVPWLRPAELASDTASSTEAALHALDWYQGQYGAMDGVLLLQPTSPFRSPQSVLRGIELYRAHERRPVVGVSPTPAHPLWCFKVEGYAMHPYIDGGGFGVRSQDLPPAYIINGAFYVVEPQYLRTKRSFFSDDMVPLVMPAEEGIDIDTEWDWNVAETYVRMTEPRFSHR